jgi:hypothetical protein
VTHAAKQDALPPNQNGYFKLLAALVDFFSPETLFSCCTCGAVRSAFDDILAIFHDVFQTHRIQGAD